MGLALGGDWKGHRKPLGIRSTLYLGHNGKTEWALLFINYTCIEKQDPDAQRGKELIRASSRTVSELPTLEHITTSWSLRPFPPSSQQALIGLPWWLSGEESACQFRSHGRHL